MYIMVGNHKYNIYEVDSSDERLNQKEEPAIGLTNNEKGYIVIDKDLNEVIFKETLIHEILHAIIYSYGFSQCEWKEENICDFISIYLDDINRYINAYMNWRKV